MKMTNWSIVITFTSPTEAHMAKGYLEANEIDTLIRDELTVQVNNFYSNAIGGVKLLVRNSDLEDAVKLLKDGGYLPNGSSDDNKIEVVEIDKSVNTGICPFCKSDNISKQKSMSAFAVVFYLILQIFIPSYRISMKCFDCEKEWRLKRR